MRGYWQREAESFTKPLTRYKKGRFRIITKKLDSLVKLRAETNSQILALSEKLQQYCPHLAAGIVRSWWNRTDTLGHIDKSGHSYTCTECNLVLEEKEH
jgi:hypothetical protein